MKNKLDDILTNKKLEVERRKEQHPFASLIEDVGVLPPTDDFAAVLRSHQYGDVACIAEIKKASPSKGILAKSFAVEKIAREYKQGGAAALSVLTDEKYFQGNDKYLSAAKNASRLPVLRKEFIIDEYQIFESRFLGADAILLIVSALTRNQLLSYLSIANDLSLSVLVECHSKDEIEIALDAGAAIIGINNRDLQTFSVNVQLSLQLKKFIPNDCIAVSESGIRNHHTVEELAQAGFDAILVGEHLMMQADKANALRQLLRKTTTA